MTALNKDARRHLGMSDAIRAHGLDEGHSKYLPWHRERVFLSRAETGSQATLGNSKPGREH
jgi:hypothetical protein